MPRSRTARSINVSHEDSRLSRFQSRRKFYSAREIHSFDARISFVTKSSKVDGNSITARSKDGFSPISILIPTRVRRFCQRNVSFLFFFFFFTRSNKEKKVLFLYFPFSFRVTKRNYQHSGTCFFFFVRSIGSPISFYFVYLWSSYAPFTEPVAI